MTVAAGRTPEHSYFPGSAMAAEAIPFEFLDSSHLAVIDPDTGVTISPSLYSIAGDGRVLAGTITALVAVDPATRWAVYSDTPREQQLDLAATRVMPMEDYETELDRRAIIERELRHMTGRAILVPRGEVGFDLPPAELRRNTYLAFDDTGGMYLAAGVPIAPPPMLLTAGIAAETLAANDFVNIFDSGADVAVRRADATDRTKFAHGFVLSGKATGQAVTVVRFGVNPVAVADVYGEVWLSATNPGKHTTVAPSGDGQIIQPLGSAVPGEGIFFTLRERVLL